MPKDYYRILGVPRSDDLKRIKKAYRKLARRFHPDASRSSSDAERFLQAQEAYDVLADSRRRREHDRALDTRAREESRPLRVPFTAFGLRRADWRRPPSQVCDIRFSEPLRGVRPIRGPLPTFLADLVLSPLEAREGVSFFLPLARETLCGTCLGRGLERLGVCLRCGGTGNMVQTWHVRISVPACTEDGTSLSLPMAGPRESSCFLHLQIRIEGG